MSLAGVRVLGFAGACGVDHSLNETPLSRAKFAHYAASDPARAAHVTDGPLGAAARSAIMMANPERGLLVSTQGYMCIFLETEWEMFQVCTDKRSIGRAYKRASMTERRFQHGMLISSMRGAAATDSALTQQCRELWPRE